MLETQPLDGVSQLAVHAEIVRIELELVALEQGALLVHIHQQGRDLAVNGEFPMPVFRRVGLEIDAGLAVVQFAFCLGHGCPRNVAQEVEIGRLRRLALTDIARRRVSALMSASSCARSSRLMNCEVARKVASGASRWGACRVFGNRATSTGQ